MTQADRDLNKLEEKFKQKVDLFLAEVEPMGVFVTEAWRSEKRQTELIEKGLSKVGTSQHQKGLAIDIAFKDDPRTKQTEKELYPAEMSRWREAADIAKKYGIDWGYDLWLWDKPHFQDNGEILSSNNDLSMLDETTQKILKKNFSKKSISELRRIAIEWNALDAFEAGLKTLKPENLNDLRSVILSGRLLLLLNGKKND